MLDARVVETGALHALFERAAGGIDGIDIGAVARLERIAREQGGQAAHVGIGPGEEAPLGDARGGPWGRVERQHDPHRVVGFQRLDGDARQRVAAASQPLFESLAELRQLARRHLAAYAQASAAQELVCVTDATQAQAHQRTTRHHAQAQQHAVAQRFCLGAQLAEAPAVAQLVERAPRHLGAEGLPDAHTAQAHVRLPGGRIEHDLDARQVAPDQRGQRGVGGCFVRALRFGWRLQRALGRLRQRETGQQCHRHEERPRRGSRATTHTWLLSREAGPFHLGSRTEPGAGRRRVLR
ncbi:MAG: hypothetical protein QM756_01670 [Polyangiaceae bacterium]